MFQKSSMATVKSNRVENSKKTLPAITTDHQAGLIRNAGKRYSHYYESNYCTSRKEEDPSKPLSVDERDALSPCYEAVMSIDDAPKGSHFFLHLEDIYEKGHVHPHARHELSREKNAAFMLHNCDNAFIKTCVLAFQHHLPLRLTPDDILLLMTSGVHFWLAQLDQDAHADRLTSGKREKTQLVVPIKHSFDDAIPTLETMLFDALSPDMKILLEQRFSTTTDQIHHSHVLFVTTMCQRVVEVTFNTMCGIPSVTLEGTRDDWQQLEQLCDVILRISDGALGPWITNLRKAFKVILDTVDGADTSGIWDNFINHDYECRRSACSGWINVFFPFIWGNTYRPTLVRNPAMWNEGFGWDQMNCPDVGLHDNYYSYEKPPLVFTNYDKFPPTYNVGEYTFRFPNGMETSYRITAGMLDVVQWNDDGALQPFINYQIDTPKQ